MPKPTLELIVFFTVQDKGALGHFLRPSTSCCSERFVSCRGLPASQLCTAGKPVPSSPPSSCPALPVTQPLTRGPSPLKLLRLYTCKKMSSFCCGGGEGENREEKALFKKKKIISEVAWKCLSCCSALGKCHRTTVEQDKSSTTTLALDHGSFFVPIASWCWLSQARSGTVCLP